MKLLKIFAVVVAIAFIWIALVAINKDNKPKQKEYETALRVKAQVVTGPFCSQEIPGATTNKTLATNVQCSVLVEQVGYYTTNGQWRVLQTIANAVK